MTLEFYQVWSGRIVGEFLGFLLASNYGWWICLFNPLLFSFTFLLLYKIINPVRYQILIASLILFLMFTVSHGIRKETFTFVVGSINFRFSAVMALLQLYFIGRYLNHSKVEFEWYEILTSVISGIIVGLIMENIAGGLILTNLLLMGYRFIRVKKLDIILLFNVIATTGAFLIMRLSPGSRARASEHTEWMTKNLFEKVATNYSEFIHYTFTENWMVIIALLSPLYVFCTPFIVSLNEADGTSFWKFTSYAYYFIDKNSLTLMGYWTFIAILIFGVMLYLVRRYQSVISVCFYYLLAMAVMGAMVLSPIIGPRCAIFTVYFLIIVIGNLIKEVNVSSPFNKLMTLSFSIITILIFSWYVKLYSEVSEVHQEQEKLIEFYKQNPTGDLSLPSYPINSIHSGQAETPYHQKVFKMFYGLDESVKIHYN